MLLRKLMVRTEALVQRVFFNVMSGSIQTLCHIASKSCNCHLIISQICGNDLEYGTKYTPKKFELL